MKKEFSTKWEGSKQPRKQRKFRAKAPLHLRKKFVSVNLSKELRKKHGKRNVPVKTGDVVKILRGKFKGKSGKITKVWLKISKVTIDGIQATKNDGSKVNVKMQPSNLQITTLNEEGGKRFGQRTKSSASSADASSNEGNKRFEKTKSETSKKQKSDDKVKKTEKKENKK